MTASAWQGELARDLATVDAAERQRIIERIKKEKYITGDGRWVDPVAVVVKILLDNAVPKLANDRSNLVVVSGDLFMSPIGTPLTESRFRRAFAGDYWSDQDQQFRGQTLERVGAVLLLEPESTGGQVRYKCELHVNDRCLETCALPGDTIATLRQLSEESAREDKRIFDAWRGVDTTQE